MLNDDQLKFIAEVLGNLGLVILASIVIPAFQGGQDKYFVLTGIVYVYTCWFLGIYILKTSNKEDT